jgi:hypothetical protein
MSTRTLPSPRELVPREELGRFHDEAHARPGVLAGWLRVRRYRRARRKR